VTATNGRIDKIFPITKVPEPGGTIQIACNVVTENGDYWCEINDAVAYDGTLAADASLSLEKSGSATLQLRMRPRWQKLGRMGVEQISSGWMDMSVL